MLIDIEVLGSEIDGEVEGNVGRFVLTVVSPVVGSERLSEVLGKVGRMLVLIVLGKLVKLGSDTKGLLKDMEMDVDGRLVLIDRLVDGSVRLKEGAPMGGTVTVEVQLPV